MAKSKYEYVRSFELDDSQLPNTWMVVRIDGCGFHKFSQAHAFEKPNDKNALDLMNKCAEAVMISVQDVVLAYGESDEYSFVLRKSSQLYSRRASKISSIIVSLFSSNYVFFWPTFFPDKKLLYPPSFDGRVVCYPSDQNLRDYLSWRQADCHINNLYNTTFWAIVHSGKTEKEAETILRGTFAKDKNEILFNQFNINYNNLPSMFRKGSVVIKKEVDIPIESSKTGEKVIRRKSIPTILHSDIIGDEFWVENSHILES